MPKEPNNTKRASQSTSNTDQKPSKMTAKRIAALLGIVLLVALYVVTFLVAIFDRSASSQWFMICLIATVTVPILLWIYIWIYGVLTNTHTIASIRLEKKEEKIESDGANKTGEASDQE